MKTNYTQLQAFTLFFKSILLGGFIIISGCNNGDEDENLAERNIVTIPEGQELVYGSAGKIQCDLESGLTTSESAQKLIDNGIDVTSSYCGYISDMAVVTVCGAGTLDIILHLIPIQNSQDAQDLGFSLASEMIDGYELNDCE